MRTKTALIACLALLTHSARARLGETVAECDVRYGEPASVEDETQLEMKGVSIRNYTFEGYTVAVCFANNRSGSETFTLIAADENGRNKIPDEDRDAILLKNLGPGYKPYEEKGDYKGTLRWRGQNGNTAMIETQLDKPGLTVGSAEYDAFIHGAYNATPEMPSAGDIAAAKIADAVARESVKKGTAVGDGKYVRLSLPRGMTVEVPTDWWMTTAEHDQVVSAQKEALLKLANVPMLAKQDTVFFKALAMPRETTYARIAVSARDTEITAERLKELTPAELEKMSAAFKSLSNQAMPAVGGNMDSTGIKVIQIDGVYGLETNYQRSSDEGDVRSCILKMIVADKQITIQLAYRVSEAALWKPVIDHVKSSVSFKK